MPTLHALVLLFAGVAAGQQTLPEDVLALSRISRRAVERLERMGNFTCLETVGRWSRPATQQPLKLIDTVRVEVAHIGDRDLYSFPGARIFEDKTLAGLVGTGLGASGTFVAHLRAVFHSGGAVIRYSGEERTGRQRIFRYGYHVPLLFHHLDMQVANSTGVASIKGSFWADTATNDVLRLDVEAADIPPGVPISEFVTRIEYGSVQLGGESVWLPQRSDLRITYLSGREDYNRSEFTHCRQYVGESAVHFGEDARPAGAAPRITDIQLPAGLTVPLELENEIDSEKTFAGDPLTATVTEDVAVRRAGIVIPKGAVVRGRVRLLYRGTEPLPHFVVALEFIEVEFAGKRAPFYGKLAQMPAVPGLDVFLSGTSSVSRENLTFYTYRETVGAQQIRPPDVPGLSTFLMRGASFRLPKGLRMLWRTADPRK